MTDEDAVESSEAAVRVLSRTEVLETPYSKMQRIIEEVAARHGLTEAAIHTSPNLHKYAHARGEAAYRMRTEIYPAPSLARMAAKLHINGKPLHHTTVLFGIKSYIKRHAITDHQTALPGKRQVQGLSR